MAKITEFPFDLEDHSAYEVAEFYVKSKKAFADSEVDYIESLIKSLEFIRTFYQAKEDEQS